MGQKSGWSADGTDRNLPPQRRPPPSDRGYPPGCQAGSLSCPTRWRSRDSRRERAIRVAAYRGAMDRSEKSGFWFQARLSPASDARFWASEESIGDGLMFDAVWDGLALWSRPDLEPPHPPWRDAVRSPHEAERMFRLIAAAYALLTGDAFEVRVTGWIEAVEAEWRDTIVGFAVERFSHEPPYTSPANVRLCAAARLAVAASHAPGTRLALLDFWASVIDRGDDAFFFAFRAVEDLARHYGGGTKDWAALHRHCGYVRGQARLKPLTDARHAVAHGDDADSAVIKARAQRLRILNLARLTVARAFVRDRHMPLDRQQVKGYR
jgi:hypothetical protein